MVRPIGRCSFQTLRLATTSRKGTTLSERDHISSRRICCDSRDDIANVVLVCGNRKEPDELKKKDLCGGAPVGCPARRKPYPVLVVPGRGIRGHITIEAEIMPRPPPQGSDARTFVRMGSR